MVSSFGLNKTQASLKFLLSKVKCQNKQKNPNIPQTKISRTKPIEI